MSMRVHPTTAASAVSAISTAISKAGIPAITALAVHALSKVPGAQAMRETGLQVCLGACYHQYTGSNLERCIQNCWRAYTQPW